MHKYMFTLSATFPLFVRAVPTVAKVTHTSTLSSLWKSISTSQSLLAGSQVRGPAPTSSSIPTTWRCGPSLLIPTTSTSSAQGGETWAAWCESLSGRLMIRLCSCEGNTIMTVTCWRALFMRNARRWLLMLWRMTLWLPAQHLWILLTKCRCLDIVILILQLQYMYVYSKVLLILSGWNYWSEQVCRPYTILSLPSTLFIF